MAKELSERELEAIHRKLDTLLGLSIYTIAIASYRPKRRTLGDRLWDLI